MKTEQINQTQMVDGASATVEPVAVPVQLADYQLEDKLGSGGYGEVWRAIGPGGLPKAVKILYGARHGEHAEAEMKALERMRHLRHPFLLNIERIEVVDSRLIVVTELADGNLTDRFANCRREGRHGIPRDELLGYLRDSADALDFMFEQHGLQHLDIKPDNILLQGNHAKVGDFGLAKDLNATNVSLVNGFTPLYAAPELFEGRPGRATDQYSLAIVYQAMLTGKPPFSGRTAAQLTAQHLRSQPDLSELQPIDRPVIARALSKNTNSRFDNCRQFVDELVRRKHSRVSQRAVVNTTLEDDNPLVQTELVKTKGSSGLNSQFNKESEPIPTKPVAAAGKPLRKSMVIGIGGLGGATILELKAQATDQPANTGCEVPILAIDTCQASLSGLRAPDGVPGLSDTETIGTPLRTPKAYRAASNLDLGWMSRRWLFNIPRNCQVEGIRPLGRLALYDHRLAVEKRILEMLKEAQSTEDEGVDVYVVGSTAGGTASGMILDVGLMVRRIIRQRKLSGIEIHSVLLHGTGALRKAVDVQEANTASLMKELQHLSTPGLGTARGFTNDQTFRDATPFDNTFFLHLGDGLSTAAFQQKTSTVASMLTCLTKSAAQFDIRAWGQQAKIDFEIPDGLRIMGIDQQDAGTFETASEQSQSLCNGLLNSWCTPADSEHLETEINATLTDSHALLEELKLTDNTLTKQVMLLLRGDLGKEIEAYATVVNRELIARVDSETVTHNELLDAVSVYLSAQNPIEGSRTLHDIVRDVQKSLSATTRNCEAALSAHLQNHLNSPYRIQGAEVVSRFMVENLLKTRKNCEGLLSEIERAFQGLVNTENPDGQFAEDSQMLPIEQVAAFGQQYCVLLAYQTVYQCFIQHIESILTTVETFRKSVAAMRQRFADFLESQEMSDTPQEVVDAFDKHLRTNSPGVLADQLKPESTIANSTNFLAAAAVQFLVAGSDSQETLEHHSKTFPENAWPVFKKLGGRRRVLGVIPESLNADEWNRRLTEEFGDCVAIRSVTGSSATAICEIEGISMGTIFSKLTHDNPHIADVASRVHTRTDIEW